METTVEVLREAHDREFKIHVKHQKRLHAELKRVNGRATTNTFSPFTLQEQCDALERRLRDAKIPSTARVGCKAVLVSGSWLFDSYEHFVIRTEAHVERFTADWFVTKLRRLDDVRNEGVAIRPTIWLTEKARDRMMESVLSNSEMKVIKPSLTLHFSHGDYNEDHDRDEGQGERPGRPGKRAQTDQLPPSHSEVHSRRLLSN